MRIGVLSFFIALLLTGSALAAELPEELYDALPEAAVEAAEGGATAGWETLGERFCDAVRSALTGAVRGAVLLALLALLTGAAQGLAAPAGNAADYVPLAGVLGVTALAAGDFSTLIGLGTATMQELSGLTRLLLPTMAAAIAGSGSAITASAWQVGTLWVSDVLGRVIEELLLPLVYCHIALATAGAALPESGLDHLADGVKKFISWGLGSVTALFALYLSVSNVLTGSADRAAVKAVQAAVSGAVPVVGGILAETAETVFGAAHSLRAAIGAAGIFGVLLVSLSPLVRLGVQLLLYKAAAFVSAAAGVKPLERLLEQLGDAFGLVFAMTAACAMVLLVSLLVSISMVVI